MRELGNHEWMNFMRNFEVADPEPKLTYKTLDGVSGYTTATTLDHMAWHRRLTDAWMNRCE